MHQHNISCINGNICTGTNGNTDVSTGESRCIVDAVTHHGNLSVALE
ncbi:hypothetical protein EVA_13192 [gut metagenome]|uniref:Uncharacterized protein n=1 Tax=gut metagenome TaxID=749906 RepID=J9GAC0_9ZZZZ